MYILKKTFYCCGFILLIAGNAMANRINVKDYGAKGNGVTDDTRFIQAAINAASADQLNTIYFPAGIYRIGSYTLGTHYFENFSIRLHSNLLFTGENEKTIIRLGDHLYDKTDSNANAHIFFGTNVYNIHFSRLTIDMNGANNKVPQHILKNHSAIFLSGGSNFSAKNITVKNCAGSNMIIIKDGGSNASIEHCRFINGGNYTGVKTPNKYQVDFSFIYTEWDSSYINNNHIEQENTGIALQWYTGGIEIHGSFSEANDNFIRGCFPAVYITSSNGPMQYVQVNNNQMKECLKGISFWVMHPMHHISIQNNRISLTQQRLIDPGNIAGIEIPNGNAATYSFNMANAAALDSITITNNRISAALPAGSKNKSIGMILHSLQNSLVSGNTISRMNYAGIILLGSKWGMQKLSIVNNRFTLFEPNMDEQGVAGYIIVTDTYSPKDPLAPGFKNILVEKNEFIRDNETHSTATRKKVNAKGKFMGAFIALPSRMLPEIKFSNNHFSDASEKPLKVKTD